MTCNEFPELIVDYLEGFMSHQAQEQFELHMKQCPACKALCADIAANHERLRKNAQATQQPALAGTVMNRILREQTHNLRKINMFTRYAKVVLASAATAAVLALALHYAFTGSSGPVAYAMEQTTQANKNIRFYHIRVSPAEKGIDEAWAELDAGNIIRLRMSFPKTEDGAKVVLWEKDKAKVWMKDKNAFVIVREANAMKQLEDLAQTMDPKAVFDKLTRRLTEGACSVETTQPAKEGDPVILKVTEVKTPKQYKLVYIDPKTKLVTRLEKYAVKNDAGEMISRLDYLEYNQQTDANIFILEPPKDATVVDQTTQVVGLAQGDLSDKEIVSKVAREFFDAMVAKDYAKMGQLMEGIPEAKMRETFGKIKNAKIISIGSAESVDGFGKKAYRVECVIELEDEQQKTTRTFRPMIRPVYNQPDRWTIFGGI